MFWNLHRKARKVPKWREFGNVLESAQESAERALVLPCLPLRTCEVLVFSTLSAKRCRLVLRTLFVTV